MSKVACKSRTVQRHFRLICGFLVASYLVLTERMPDSWGRPRRLVRVSTDAEYSTAYRLLGLWCPGGDDHCRI